MSKARLIAAITVAFLALGSLLSPAVANAGSVVYYHLDPAQWARIAQQHGYPSSPAPGQPYRPLPTPPSRPTPPTPPVQQPIQPVQPGVGDQAMQMVDLVNQQRARAGLAPLKADPTLMELARKKAQDMVNNAYFAHQSPTYGSVFDMLAKAGISYRGAGENLAKASSVSSAMAALMRSPSHRQNILTPGWTNIGIGVVPSNGGVTVCQIFIAR